MNSITFQIDSELDFHRITDALKTADIPYVYQKYTDAAFPAIGVGKPFGTITISSLYEENLKTLIQELTHTAPKLIQSTSAEKVNKSIWSIILITYAIAISLLCFRYWFINYRNAQDKNNRFEWSIDGQDLMMINKKTGTITHRYTDSNYDLNFEESKMYSKDGFTIGEFNDMNEDGIYEAGYLYNLKNELIAAQFDHNHDGIYEEIFFILENGDTLKLIDTNKNGFLEIPKH